MNTYYCYYLVKKTHMFLNVENTIIVDVNKLQNVTNQPSIIVKRIFSEIDLLKYALLNNKSAVHSHPSVPASINHLCIFNCSITGLIKNEIASPIIMFFKDRTVNSYKLQSTTFDY